MKYTNLTIAAMLAVLTHVAAEEDGAALADTCLGCHGVPSYTNVYPTYKVPKLAGQHKEYLVAALQEYRAGNRSHPTMTLQAKRLSNDDAAAIAAYFSQIESAQGNPNAPIPDSINAQVATCSACHGNDGNSPTPIFPKIAGQHESYIYESLKNYKSGKRKNPIMLGIVGTLSEQDMKDLAEYFSSRKGLGTIVLPHGVME